MPVFNRTSLQGKEAHQLDQAELHPFVNIFFGTLICGFPVPVENSSVICLNEHTQQFIFVAPLPAWGRAFRVHNANDRSGEADGFRDSLGDCDACQINTTSASNMA